MLAAEQLVDGHAERLALDVVERDVDGADRGGEHAAALEILAAVHLLPERARAHRVAPDHELAKMLDRAGHGALAPGKARFAPAENPLIRLDLDDELVAHADPDDQRMDGGYFHASSSPAVFRGGPAELPLQAGRDQPRRRARQLPACDDDLMVAPGHAALPPAASRVECAGCVSLSPSCSRSSLAFPAAARELKIATWNLNWLTARPTGDPILPPDVQLRAPGDFDLIRRYALFLDADVVAIEEVDGPAVAARIFPPDRYAIHMTTDHVVQRVGFAIRRGIPFTANPDLAALDPDPAAPFPLRSGADITLHLAGGPLRLLAMHLKTGCWEKSLRSHLRACETLNAQLPGAAGLDRGARARADALPRAR